MLVTLAWGHHPAPRALREAIAWAAREGVLVELELPPLSRKDADELLGTQVDAAHRDALYSNSGGNPLYLTELVRARARGESRAKQSGEGPPANPPAVPDAVAAAID